MRRRLAGAIPLGVLLWPVLSAADPETTPPVQPTAAGLPRPDGGGTEVGLFPLVGGDTDNGFGAGAIGSVAAFDSGSPLYRWKLDFSGFYATKTLVPRPSYVDGAVNLTLPRLLDDHLRLEIRPAFTYDDALPFYGIGNNVKVPKTTDASRDFYQRIHPAVSVTARWRLSAHWFALDGAQAQMNKLATAADSTLTHDLAASDPYLTRLHGLVKLHTGLAYDTRDNEISPNSGQWHEVKIRVSPNLGSALPYGYEQYNAIARFYRTLIPNTLVLAVRGVLDLQMGNVPIYEESRYESTSAIGGGLGVRGVPAYSFYGRVKAFGNLELRARIWRFAAVNRRFVVGFAGFLDGGRLWADIRTAHPELDGTGLGLHYGVGGGLRIQQGRAFLVRVDIAWSPDARPIGAYLQADEAF